MLKTSTWKDVSHNNARCEVHRHSHPGWFSCSGRSGRSSVLPILLPLTSKTHPSKPSKHVPSAIPREGDYAQVAGIWVAVLPAGTSKLNAPSHLHTSSPDVTALDLSVVPLCPSKFRHIYWSDARRQRIEVAELDGRYRKWLITTQLDQPAAVVVNPKLGWVFEGGAFHVLDIFHLDSQNITCIWWIFLIVLKLSLDIFGVASLTIFKNYKMP